MCVLCLLTCACAETLERPSTVWSPQDDLDKSLPIRSNVHGRRMEPQPSFKLRGYWHKQTHINKAMLVVHKVEAAAFEDMYVQLETLREEQRMQRAFHDRMCLFLVALLVGIVCAHGAEKHTGGYYDAFQGTQQLLRLDGHGAEEGRSAKVRI